jgi:acetyl esterase/lipase
MTDLVPRIPFHPELSRLGRALPKTVITPFSLKFVRRFSRLPHRRPPKDVEVVTLDSGVRVWVYRPKGTCTGPGLLWIHGGGYLIGSPGQDDELCRRYARELGATVASVDYRLAPEHQYPVPLEDCYAALIWLANERTVDGSRIAVAGASAGGGLAAALTQLAHDRGDVSIRAQLLVYPMLDDRTADRDDLDQSGLRIWDKASNRFAWAAYLGGADPDAAVPARREDLRDLPPTWIGVGTLDLFHDEDLRYAERLSAAGVHCDVEEVQGAFHGFDGMAPKARVSKSFFASQCAMLHRAFAPNAA